MYHKIFIFCVIYYVNFLLYNRIIRLRFNPFRSPNVFAPEGEDERGQYGHDAKSEICVSGLSLFVGPRGVSVQN